MRKLTLIVLMLIGLTSCSKKENETTVKGAVVDKTNLNRVPNATVFLMKENLDCFSCQGSKVEKYTADVNGEFNFVFETESDFSYSVVASSSNYWDSASGGVRLDKGEKNTAVLPLQPEAFLRLFIKNTSPFDGDDVISTGSFGGGGDSFYGMAIDTIYIKRVLGNTNTEMFWGVTKNNITTTYPYNVYTSAFDTTDFTINY